MDRRACLQGAVALAALSGGCSPAGEGATPAAAAKAYPSKPVSLIVAYTAGGLADFRARLVTAVRRVSRATPDGHTLLNCTSSTIILVPQLTQGFTFDPMKDLTVVSQLFTQPAVVMVSRNSPYNTIEDLMNDARRRPGKVRYATPGTNSISHLCGETLARLAGTTMVHVPYQSSTQFVLDLVAGRLEFAFGAMGTLIGATSQLKGLLVAADQRSKFTPDVPSTREAGFTGLNIPMWVGLFAPPATPPETIGQMDVLFAEMFKDTAFQQGMDRLGVEPEFRPSAEFHAALLQQYKEVGGLIASAGLKPTG
jgi:tripartite-type tricarboxylate transporter receptor subunit TctC